MRAIFSAPRQNLYFKGMDAQTAILLQIAGQQNREQLIDYVSRGQSHVEVSVIGIES